MPHVMTVPLDVAPDPVVDGGVTPAMALAVLGGLCCIAVVAAVAIIVVVLLVKRGRR